MRILKLIAIVSFCLTATLSKAQKAQTNIQKFQQRLTAIIRNKIIYTGFDFEWFAIAIKVNGKGVVDTARISLSINPQIRDSVVKAIKMLDYADLKKEIKVPSTAIYYNRRHHYR